MTTSTVEDYLKRIYLEGGSFAGDLVPMGRLARAMDVTPGTVTTMVKSLVDGELVQYVPYAGVRLSRAGQSLALRILRRHRVLELFLVDALGMDWSDVHAEAEKLEHAASDHVIDRMDEYLGHPSFDPHGDPIPNTAGVVVGRDLRALSELEVGAVGLVRRIADQTPSFLREVEELGLVPGASVTMRERGDPMLALRIDASDAHVSPNVADKILVEKSTS